MVSVVEWDEAGDTRAAQWRAEGTPPPRRLVAVDDTLTADAAYRLACEGTAMVWRGDYHNARQLLQALARRIDRPKGRKTGAARPDDVSSPGAQAFHLYRQSQAQRARLLGMLLLPFEPGHGLTLRRAPDVRDACEQALGPADMPYLLPLRALQGVIGAAEWRRKGVPVPALGAAIHPHYGVFAPVRGEYVALVAQAPLPADTSLAVDVGTGTGVLAALLARRGVARVIATDTSPRALACARDNVERLGLSQRVTVCEHDLFPPEPSPLIVCNPPWLPGKATTTLEQAVYDPGSRMLQGFIDGLAAQLTPGGEGWLILSDLAEHLGLRSREALLAMFAQAGLTVLARMDTRPTHGRAQDAADVLHAARAAEVTSLWRLGRAEAGRA